MKTIFSKEVRFYPAVNKKVLNLFLAVCFLLNQILPPALAQSMMQNEQEHYVPVITLNEGQETGSQENTNQNQADLENGDETSSFLEQELSLEKSEESEEESENSRDLPEYSFDDAIQYLTPDFSAAVVVKSLTAEDLKKLTELEIEVGVAVIKGKIVLFTSGSEDEIRMLAPVKTLLEDASLIAHTHPTGNSKPSFQDIQEAGEEVEYVIGDEGIYAYNQNGFVQENPLTYNELAQIISNLYDEEASSKQTRLRLNRFIRLMDEFNEAEENGILFRSNHIELFPDPSVTFDDITPVPLTSQGARPNFTQFASGDGSSTTVALNSQSSGQLTYNGTGVNSFGGAFIAYDNSGTPGVETINLNVLFPQGIVLGLVSPLDNVPEISLEITDINDARSSVTLSGIDGSTQLWKILVSDFDGVATTQIKTISFVFHGQANNARLSFDWGNFAFIPFIAPDLNRTADDLTVLPGAPQPTLVIAQPNANNFVTTSPGNRGTRLVYDSGSQAFVGGGYTFDNGNTPALETTDLSGLSEIVLGLKGNPAQVKLEIIDDQGRKANFFLTTISPSQENVYVIPTADIQDQGVDLTKVHLIYAIVEGQNQQGILDINHLPNNFVIPPDPALVQGNVTKLPLLTTSKIPELTGFASEDGSSALITKTSQTLNTITYNGADGNSFGGGFISYDDFSTNPAVEFINLNTVFPSGIVFGLNSPNSSVTQVTFEITDINGDRDSVTLTGIDSTNRFWKVLASAFSDVDLTQITTLTFVFKGQLPDNQLRVNWGDFLFTPSVSPDPTKTAADISLLNGIKSISAFDSNNPLPNGVASLNQLSQTRYNLTYDVTPGDSFAGSISSFDDFATNPVEETINLTGQTLVIGLRDAGVPDRVTIELEDSTGAKDLVYLTGIDATERFFSIAANLFEGVNLTLITGLNIVVEQTQVADATSTLEVRLGTYPFIPSVPPDPAKTGADVTKLPLNGLGNRPEFVGFAKQDGSTSTIQNFSQSFVRFTYNGAAADSFGGAFITYDNPATANTTESINLSNLFPNGLVFGLDNPIGNLTEVTLELTDASGAKDKITLTGIAIGKQFWSVALNLFDGVNLTQISTIAFVVPGQIANAQLSVDWGDFAFIATTLPDPTLTQADITKLPLNGLGNRVQLNTFASNDGSSATRVISSQDFARLTYTGTGAASFGGVAVNYDDAATANTVEFINFSTQYPAGFVFEVDNNGTALTGAFLQLRDNTGKTSRINIGNIIATGQRYKVLANQFFGIDTTKISEIVFGAEGQKAAVNLSLNLGEWEFTPTTLPDPTLTQADITKLPLNGLGNRVQLNTFASNDGSSATRVISSQDFARLTYTGIGAASFGGVAVNYDDAATANTVEFINFSALYPAGFVFEVDNNGTALTGAFLQLRDNTGKTSRINIGNIIATGQRYKVLASQLFGIDTTKISEIVFGVEGQLNNVRLSLNLGEWEFTPTTLPDPALTLANVTKLPLNSLGNRVQLNTFASNDGSSATRVISSQDFSRLTYTGTGAASFGGVAVNYDDAATANTVESINFNTLYPTGFVFGVDNNNTALTGAFLQLRDNTGKTSRINIGNIIATGQFYKVMPNQFFGIDMTKISEIVFGAEGQTAAVNLSLILGEWEFTPTTLPDPTLTQADITKLPLNGLGQRVNLNTFVSNDGSTAARTLFSHTFARMNYTGTGAASFGGVAVNYDDAATANTVEFINFSTQYPAGFVFEVDNNGTALTGAFLQLRDNTGKTSRINIGNIIATGQRYKVLASQLFGIDTTKISEIVFGVEGQLNNVRLSLNLGEWEFTPSFNPDPTKTQANITKLPLNSLGEAPELVGFASQDGSTGNVLMQSQTIGQIQYTGTGAASFGGAFIPYDNPDTNPAKETINLATLFPSGIILGLNSPNSTVTSAILEVVDSTGAKDQVILTGITSAAQRWLIPTNQFNDVNINAITTISIVVAGQVVNGQLNVDWGNFKFIPSVTNDPTKTAANVSLLSGIRGLTSFDSDAPNPDSIFSLSQTSATQFSLTYNLVEEDSFGGSITTFDNFSTTSKEKVDLTGQTLVFGLRDAGAPAKVILQLEDTDGKKDQVVITGVDATEKFFSIPVSLFDGINKSRVTGLVFLVEEDNVTDTTSTLEIRFGTHKFIKPVVPNGSLDSSDITLFTNVKHLEGFDSDTPDATLNLTQLSKTRFNLDYNVTQDGSFVGSITSFDDFGTPGIETKDLRSQTIRLGLRDAGSPRVIVQLEDINGGRDQVVLNGVDGTERFFEMSTSLFDGVNLRFITGLVILIEEDRVTDPTSTLEVRLGNHPFIPAVAPDPTKTAANVSLLSSIQHLVSFDSNAPSPEGTAAVAQSSATRFNISYDVTNPGSFGGSITSFDNFNTTGTKERVSLTGQTLVIGLRDPGVPGRVVIQLEDSDGKKSKVYLTGVDATERFFSIAASLFEGINLGRITGIVLLVEQGNVTDPTSTLEVRFGNHPFRGPFAPDAALTQANLTVLPTPIGAILTGGSNAGSTINRVNSSRVDLNYTLAAGTFAGMTVNYDNFSTGTIERKDFTGFSELIVGLAGQPGDQVKVEIIDSNGARNFIILGSLLATEQFYHVPLSLFTGVNLSRVRFINFIVDNTLVTNPNGTITVRVQPV